MSRSLDFGRRERSTGRGSPVIQANLGSAVSLGCPQCVFPPSSGRQCPSGLDHRSKSPVGLLHIGQSLSLTALELQRKCGKNVMKRS